MSLAKLRVLSTDTAPFMLGNTEITPTKDLELLGCCLHLGATSNGQCPRSRDVHREAIARVDRINNCTSCGLRRGIMYERYVLPLLCTRIDSCFDPFVSSLQAKMNKAFTRGIPNRNCTTRGLKAGYPARASDGGRNVPDVRQYIYLTSLRAVRMAAACPFVGAPGVIACCRAVFTTHTNKAQTRRMFSVWKAAMNSFDLTMVYETVAPPPPLHRHRFTGSPTDLCCDASYDSGKVVLGFATASGSNFSVKLEGLVTNSFEAEMAGICHSAPPEVGRVSQSLTHQQRSHRLLLHTEHATRDPSSSNSRYSICGTNESTVHDTPALGVRMWTPH